MASLQNQLCLFVELVSEMKKSLLFPSLLMDIQINRDFQGIEIFRNPVSDLRSLYDALLIIREDILSGFKEDTSVTNDENSQRPIRDDLTIRFGKIFQGLKDAVDAAKLVKNKYCSMVDEYVICRRRRNTDVEDSDNLMTTLNKFETLVLELESLVLVPHLLRDVQDQQVVDSLEKAGFFINKGSSLLDVFEFLKELRDHFTALESDNTNGKFKAQTIHLEISKLYATVSVLIQLTVGVMRQYNMLLEKNTGETTGNAWNNGLMAQKHFDGLQNASISQAMITNVLK